MPSFDIGSGTIALGNNVLTGPSGAVVVVLGNGTSSGVLSLNGYNQTLASLTVSGSGGAYDILSGGTLGGNVTQLGQLTVEINALAAPGSQVDLLNVSGLYSLTNATVDFNIVNPLDPAGEYMFATYGTLSGQPYAFDNVPAGYRIEYNYYDSGSYNHIALVPIPEPATIAGLAPANGMARTTPFCGRVTGRRPYRQRTPLGG